MSNKDWNKLADIDRRLRLLFPVTMINHTTTIKLKSGFELFNTRPYHNYESWSDGYYIETDELHGNIKVQAEDLDDAITLLEKEVSKFRDNNKE